MALACACSSSTTASLGRLTLSSNYLHLRFPLIPKGIGESECRFYDPDFDGIGRQDFDYVKPESEVGHIKQAEPVHGPIADELLLLTVDGIEGTSHLFGTAGLHLSKDQGITIPADKIDLPSPGSAEVLA